MTDFIQNIILSSKSMYHFQAIANIFHSMICAKAKHCNPLRQIHYKKETQFLNFERLNILEACIFRVRYFLAQLDVFLRGIFPRELI